MNRPAIVAHPAWIDAFGADALRPFGEVFVAARLDAPPVPLDTWLAMTHATPPAPPAAPTAR